MRRGEPRPSAQRSLAWPCALLFLALSVGGAGAQDPCFHSALGANQIHTFDSLEVACPGAQEWLDYTVLITAHDVYNNGSVPSSGPALVSVALSSQDSDLHVTVAGALAVSCGSAALPRSEDGAGAAVFANARCAGALSGAEYRCAAASVTVSGTNVSAVVRVFNNRTTLATAGPCFSGVPMRLAAVLSGLPERSNLSASYCLEGLSPRACDPVPEVLTVPPEKIPPFAFPPHYILMEVVLYMPRATFNATLQELFISSAGFAAGVRYQGRNRNQVNITRVVQFLNPTRISVQFIVQADNLEEAQSLAQVLSLKRLNEFLVPAFVPFGSFDAQLVSGPTVVSASFSSASRPHRTFSLLFLCLLAACIAIIKT
ncbi:hypothetical protein T484DRAFT_1948601 [Baffinella frigidus]|nr:hypothetical protein T484DRAFT_1948601 [Cryptophyta sp. CCMP2293]